MWTSVLALTSFISEIKTVETLKETMSADVSADNSADFFGNFYTLIQTFSGLLTIVEGVKINHLWIPDPVRNDSTEPVILDCDYSLDERDKVAKNYSLKSIKR
jgi:hypothetical protein